MGAGGDASCFWQLLSVDPLTAEAIFSRFHPGFDGHFPDGAILPGFLHVQLALDVLRAAGLGSELRELAEAKFVTPILPESKVRIVMRPDEKPGWYAVMISDEHGREHSRFSVMVG